MVEDEESKRRREVMDACAMFSNAISNAAVEMEVEHKAADAALVSGDWDARAKHSKRFLEAALRFNALYRRFELL